MAKPAAIAASANKDVPVAASISSIPVMDNTSFTDYSADEDAIMEHRALHRFMTNLLDQASVSALHTFLIQDNASILTKSASRSAHAAHKRLFLGRNHLVTKEISRWESYPFEVDHPILVSRPKKCKNGVAPQRRAKRRSGRESVQEIKADIAKKAASLPRAPRRRSSVRTEESQKYSMQDELISLFEADDDSCASSASNTRDNTNANRRGKNTSNSARPTRALSPRRWATPKKPIRRVSEVPVDLGPLTTDSTHSVGSTESTLSEIAARQSDLSEMSGSSSDMLASLDTRQAAAEQCGVILEEEDEQQEDDKKPAAETRGRPTELQRNNSSQSVPRKPIRRVSEVPEDLAVGDAKVNNNRVSDSSMLSVQEEGEEEEEEEAIVLPPMPHPDKLPPLARLNSIDLDFSGGENERRTGGNEATQLRGRERKMPRKATSEPTKKVSASPRMPTRRPSEVPADIIHEMHNKQNNQHSFSTESTTSETTAETLEIQSSLNCSVILEDDETAEVDADLQEGNLVSKD